MEHLLSLDIISLVEAAGYAGLAAIIFAETGLFFGFFFPGDSLLFTAGLLASQGILNIWILIPLIVIAAIAGDGVGYWFGRKVGQTLFTREDSLFFHKRHIESTRTFYATYGTKTIFLARFVPIVRTFAPILAGVGGMSYRIFLKYNILGGIVWGGGITLVGYFLGGIVPGVDRYLSLIVVGIIIVSLLPIVYEYIKNKKV